MMAAERPQLRLVTSVGTGDYRRGRYRWGDRIEEATYPCVAVARLTGAADNAATTVILTDRAYAMHWDPLAREFTAAGIEAEPVRIPEGRIEAENFRILEAVMDCVQPDESILLDVTMGLRHLPFIYLAALTYLVGLRGNRLKGIYYAAFELKGADPEIPVIDLTSLFRLMEWYRAFGAVEDTGDLRPVARLLREESAALFMEARGLPILSRASQAMDYLGEGLAMGALVEVGLEAAKVLRALAEVAEAKTAPPVRRALRRLHEMVDGRQWAVAGVGKVSDKAHIPLDAAELARQLRVIRWYAERNGYPQAMMLLREWLVNTAVLATGEAHAWLQHAVRKEAENRWHSLVSRARRGVASEAQEELARLWGRVTQKRNPIAHACMTDRPVRAQEYRRETLELLAECEGLLRRQDLLAALVVPRQGRVLISPLGLSPGTLFSAVQLVEPDMLVLVTSTKAFPLAGEALARAGRLDLRPAVVMLDDPFTGLQELAGRLDRHILLQLADAAEVVVSLTGGTALMQHLAERLGDEAAELGAAVRRCAVADRRPSAEQQADPYVLGEIVWLDSERRARPQLRAGSVADNPWLEGEE